MKSHTEYLWFNTKKHREFINITDEVEKALAKSQIKEGLILVSAMHITAGIYVNDAEDGLIADIDEWLEKLAPFRADYRHHHTGDDEEEVTRRLGRFLNEAHHRAGQAGKGFPGENLVPLDRIGQL